MDISNISNKFNSKLYNELLPGAKTKNLIYAPSALHSMLSLMLVGSEETTREEMIAGLQYDHDYNNQLIAVHYGAVLRAYVNGFENENAFPVVSARRIYRSLPKYTLERFYKHLVPQFFCDLKRHQLDLSTLQNCQESAQKMNYWVNKYTYKQIKNIITPTLLELLEAEAFGKMKCILASAVLCKERWQYPFDPSATSKETFQVTNSRKVRVDMMKHFEFFPYAALPEVDADAVEIPYAGDSMISLVIILPRTLQGLENVQSRLDTILSRENGVRSLHYRFTRKAKIALSLPRFRVQSSLCSDLVAALKSMGMNKMFENGEANFKSIPRMNTYNPQAHTYTIFISSVIQKAFLEVSEKGSCVTETSPIRSSNSNAATDDSLKSVAGNEKPKIIRFAVDHPFCFYVVDRKHNNLILLSGHCVDPANTLMYAF